MVVAFWILALVLLACMVAVAWPVLRRKNVDIIVRHRLRTRRPRVDGPTHVFFTLADHFEPYWHNQDDALARERVRRWRDAYPGQVDGIHDRGGRPPRHAFFYPQEEYRAEHIAALAELQRMGIAEVEVHIHHDNDTSDGVRAKLTTFRDTLRRDHGLLHDRLDGSGPGYAFIHGNWSLDNSSPDGRWCGVNDELIVLRETGCYADFTFPSSPHPTQPPIINTVYRATDDPHRPCSHHAGTRARAGVRGGGDMLLVTGPLAINWKRRRRGLLPAIENGDITGNYPPSPDRVALWIENAARVEGHPSWAFVKVHTHGTQEGNSRVLLGDGPGNLRSLYRHLLDRYDDGEGFVMHFSTPWEIYRAVLALESGDPGAIAAIEQFSYSF